MKGTVTENLRGQYGQIDLHNGNQCNLIQNNIVVIVVEFNFVFNN